MSYLKGKGVIFSPTNVVVYDQGKKTSYNAKNIVIATGSSSTSLPGVKIDETDISFDYENGVAKLNFPNLPYLEGVDKLTLSF